MGWAESMGVQTEILLKQKELGRAEAPPREFADQAWLRLCSQPILASVIGTAVELVWYGSSSHLEYSIHAEGKQKYSFCPQSIVANGFLQCGLLRLQLDDALVASPGIPLSLANMTGGD